MSENTVTITYNDQLEQLLKENSEECESLSILHRMSFEKYNKRSNYINIPVIILSSAIGFITGIDLQYDKMNIILGVGSVFVGIIKSVDTYFQLAKRAESHRICSLQFSQISKKLQIELTLHRKQRASAENMMNIVKTDIKNMQDIAPLIDDDIIELYNAKYRRYKRVKKPNFVNGLTEVKVNPYNNEREYEFASRHGSREASPNNAGGNAEGGGGVENQSLSVKTQSSSQLRGKQNQSLPMNQANIQPVVNANVNQLSIENEDEISIDPIAVTDQNIIVSQTTEPNLQLLQMYQQLQNASQDITNSPVNPNVTLAVTSIPPQTNSPAVSVRSTPSIHLGQIQTDQNGNPGMNI
jgi:hypothetical protein